MEKWLVDTCLIGRLTCSLGRVGWISSARVHVSQVNLPLRSFTGIFFKTKNHVLTEDTKLKITINDSLDPGNVVYDFGVDPILICFPTINGTPGHYSSHKPLLGLII